MVRFVNKSTQVENPGGAGVLEVFAKIPGGGGRGGQGFQEKLAGGSKYFAFYCICVHLLFFQKK